MLRISLERKPPHPWREYLILRPALNLLALILDWPSRYFSQPWLVPQYCLAIDVKVSPSTTTWTVAALADATLVFVAAVVGVATVDEVDGTIFPLGTTAPIGATVVDGVGAPGEDCAREVGADETVAGWPIVGAAPIEFELEVCAARAPTTAPVAVAGVKPGKLVGNGCIGVVSAVNPGGMGDGIVEVVEPVAGTDVVDGETETGPDVAPDIELPEAIEVAVLVVTGNSLNGSTSGLYTGGPTRFWRSIFSSAGFVGANHA